MDKCIFLSDAEEMLRKVGAPIYAINALSLVNPEVNKAPVVPECQNAVKLLNKEYEKAKKNPIVRDPLAYALYQTWKAVDGNRR